MNAETCPYEFVVIETTRSGEWSESLRAHVCECAECADLVRVTEWMGGVARRIGRSRPAPDSTYIWLKAQIERRAEEAVAVSRRRLRALALLNLALGLAGAAAVLSVWPEASAAVRAASTWLSTTLTETSLLDVTALGTAWLGFPLLLTAIYLLVFRPVR